MGGARRHLDVVDGTDEHSVAGHSRPLGHLNAHGLKKNTGLDIIHDKQPVLCGPHTVAGFTADEGFPFGFCDTDLRAGGDPFAMEVFLLARSTRSSCSMRI